MRRKPSVGATDTIFVTCRDIDPANTTYFSDGGIIHCHASVYLTKFLTDTPEVTCEFISDDCLPIDCIGPTISARTNDISTDVNATGKAIVRYGNLECLREAGILNLGVNSNP